MDRRSFLAELSVIAAASGTVLGKAIHAGAAPPAVATMPLISVAPHRVSRLNVTSTVAWPHAEREEYGAGKLQMPPRRPVFP